jgi:hypothetical protein
MTRHHRIVSQLAEDVEAITAGLVAALKHLEDWSGEFPTSASGAPPSSAPTPTEEAKRPLGDPAMRLQINMLGAIRLASQTARKTLADADGMELPVETLTDAHDLAVLRWAVKRLAREKVSAHKLDELSRQVAHARSLVTQHQPPSASAPSGCRIHRDHGDHVAVFRSGLCRGCWEFRKRYQCEPSAQIIRCWSKGIRPSAQQITEATRPKRKAKT